VVRPRKVLQTNQAVQKSAHPGTNVLDVRFFVQAIVYTPYIKEKRSGYKITAIPNSIEGGQTDERIFNC